MRPRAAALAALAPVLLCASARAAEDALRFYESEAQVVTASRRVEPAGEAPASVDVVTRAEIEASGAVDLCDALRFRPGLDVIDGRNTGGSNRCVISIRGMARDQVRELMVLINGRSVYSPLSGVILWEQLPIQIQDIERIEIVRGPNAALYGSGAGLGVINIITRAPKDKLSASAAATGGSQGRSIAEESFDDKHGDFSYRLSHAFRHEDGFPSVASDPANPANDFLHSQKAGARAVWRPSPQTTLDLFGSGSWDTVGEPTGFNGVHGPSPQARFRSHIETARLAHTFENESVGELALTRNEQASRIEPDGRATSTSVGSPQFIRFYEYTLDAQHSFEPWSGCHTTWGGSFRYSAADSPDLFSPATPLQVNRAVRGFVHETARLTDKLSLVGGVSLEAPYYLGTRHADYQAALLYKVLPSHVLRASYSMAHTNPGFTDAYPNFTASSIAGLGPVAVLTPNPYLKSYELQNYETGYRGFWLDRRLETGVSLYYMKIRDHVNIEDLQKEKILPAGLPEVLRFDNSNYLIGRGVELEARADLGAGRSAYANWSHETVTDRDGHSVYIRTTPSHIVNLGFIAPIVPGLTAAANAGYKGGYLADSVSGSNQVDIPPFWRLDARLSWTPMPGLDLFVGGRNLLQARHVEFVDGLTVPRAYYGGARLRFR